MTDVREITGVFRDRDQAQLAAAAAAARRQGLEVPAPEDLVEGAAGVHGGIRPGAEGALELAVLDQRARRVGWPEDVVSLGINRWIENTDMVLFHGLLSRRCSDRGWRRSGRVQVLADHEGRGRPFASGADQLLGAAEARVARRKNARLARLERRTGADKAHLVEIDHTPPEPRVGLQPDQD